MNRNTSLKYTLTGIFFILAYINMEATHLKAGLITARKLGNLQYEFTLVLYLNSNSPVKQDSAKLDFGDGSSQRVYKSSTSTLNDNTYQNTYIFRHIYGGPNIFTVSFVEQYRNGDIINMSSPLSTNFYVESNISIDPFLGPNSSPQILSPPIDQGNQNELFTYSPGAWDQDGDSLSFSMSTPKMNKGQIVSGFKDPASYGGTNEEGGPTTLSINPVTGLVSWDRPGQPGTYNIAFIITEWRNGVKIGYITVDMQINIIANTNRAPKLVIPKDTCITAGVFLKDTIIATDDIASEINMFAFSGIFDLGSNSAVTTLQYPPNPQIQPATMYFEWQTNCSLVREQPYQITFKAQDNPGNTNSLTVQRVWQIRVKAPPPKGLTATPSGRNMVLRWTKYANQYCQNADSIIILRRDCSTDTVFRDSCTTGYTIGNGFNVIGRKRASDTVFIDTNFGKGLQYEANYTYIIYAKFSAPEKGFSRPSDGLQTKLTFDVPVITNVSVQTTDSVNGAIAIKWTKPRELNSTSFPAPYKYEIYREGISPSGATSGFKLISTLNTISDTAYTDAGLNTWYNKYRYFIKFYYGGNILKSTSDTATMVKLTGISKQQRITLGWAYTTPWKNDTTIIYRITGSDTARIDTVYGTNVYTDHGKYNGDTLVPGVPYRYFVETKGLYYCGNSSIKLDISAKSLVNFSNIVVAYVYRPDQPDTNKPCPPVLFILSNNNCDNISGNYSSNNVLHWNKTLSFSCDSGITGYKLYQANSLNEQLNYFATTTDTFYLGNLSDNKPVIGCFAVIAFNRYGAESSKSNIVCSDNCNYYELPNFFSPNGDGINDLFQPFPTPRFVESVDFSVFNRWGANVFNRSDNINLQWDGSNLPDGIYYYNATVTFLNTNNRIVKKLNGWIELAR